MDRFINTLDATYRRQCIIISMIMVLQVGNIGLSSSLQFTYRVFPFYLGFRGVFSHCPSKIILGVKNWPFANHISWGVSFLLKLLERSWVFSLENYNCNCRHKFRARNHQEYGQHHFHSSSKYHALPSPMKYASNRYKLSIYLFFFKISKLRSIRSIRMFRPLSCSGGGIWCSIRVSTFKFLNIFKCFGLDSSLQINKNCS